MGQRKGFGLADEMVGDPELTGLVQDYEKHKPSEGHVLRWHMDQAIEGFDRLNLDDAETTVLHK